MRSGDLQLFTIGETLFEDLFTEIKNATHHVHILFYIVKNDRFCHEFLSLLKEKAKQGVEVRLLIDRIGGKHISRQAIESLEKVGVQFHFCHIPKFPYLFYSFNARNHRKISVIDGKIGYIGGFNIGKEYLGNDPKLGFWRDYHIKVTLEGVWDLQKQFLFDWADASNEHLYNDSTYFPSLPSGHIKMKIVPTDGAYLQGVFLNLIEQAEKEIMIGTPYFIPGDKIMKALIDAAKRGVTIKIMTPRASDHPFVKHASYPYFKILIQYGIELYHYEKGFYHAKVIVIDEKICDVGTANFDKRSLYINHEINCLIYDRDFITDVKMQLRKDLASATLLTHDDLNRNFLDRSKESISTLISHFL